MSSLTNAIVAKLKNTTAINNLISGRIAAVNFARAQARPNLTYQRLHTRDVGSNDGPTGVEFAHLQINCYADTYDAARSLAEAVKTALKGFAGTVGDVQIKSCRLDDDDDMPTPPAEGQNTSPSGVGLIFVIGYG